MDLVEGEEEVSDGGSCIHTGGALCLDAGKGESQGGDSSDFTLGTAKCEMPVRFKMEMLSLQSVIASSPRGMARQEIKMCEPSAKGWYLNPGDWMRCYKESIEREEKAVCMCVCVWARSVLNVS